jgi:hypothetical protein
VIVWLTTDWNTERMMSLFSAPWLINGWTSLFANTPHLLAMV